jgi:nicotinamide mononucleotide transporter
VNPLTWLFEAEIHFGGGQHVLWREVIGNLFGLASAFGGMRRRVWAWPVGIVGNVLLFTVFLGAVFDTPQGLDLYGQAGRQVMFAAVAVYGWYRWTTRPGRAEGGPAVVPRWATWRERAGLVAAAAVMMVVLVPLFRYLGSFGAVPDAWIFTGSLLATYGMARGWTDFWLIWLLVDVVGVPLLLIAGFYPSAVLYLVYGVFVIWGLVVWLRAQRADGVASPTFETVGG